MTIISEIIQDVGLAALGKLVLKCVNCVLVHEVDGILFFSQDYSIKLQINFIGKEFSQKRQNIKVKSYIQIILVLFEVPDFCSFI